MKSSTIAGLLVISLAISTAYGCEDEAEPAQTAAEEGAEPIAGETQAEEAEAEPAAPEGLTCQAYIAKFVSLMGDQRGSFVTADNQGEWVGLCEQAGDLNAEGNAEIASCIMEAADIEAAGECGNPRFMNQWAR